MQNSDTTLAARLVEFQLGQAALTVCLLNILRDKGIVSPAEINSRLRAVSQELAVSDAGLVAAEVVSNIADLFSAPTRPS